MSWAVVAALAAGLAVLAWRADPGGRLRVTDVTVPGPARGSPNDPGRRRWGAVAAAGSALVLVPGLGWWGVLLAGAVGAASYVVLGRLLSGDVARRRRELTGQLPQVCDLLSVCLDAGLPLRSATAVVAEALDGAMAAALGELTAKVRLGADEAQAWSELGVAEPPLATLGAEVARAAGSGVSLSRTLRSLGVDARRDAAAAAEVRARRVGVRSVLPLMVCFLPAFLLLGVVPIIGGVAQHLLR